jgi:hypothetical protein
MMDPTAIHHDEDSKGDQPMSARALGTITEFSRDGSSRFCIRNGLLDYYDHWSEIDVRIQEHHATLSRCSAVFAKDVVNLATYTHEIIARLPDRCGHAADSVVTVGSMVEAFLVSTRAAYDAVAIGLGYVAATKRGQAPCDSLNSLLKWLQSNRRRSAIDQTTFAQIVPSQFEELRSLRDDVVHRGHSIIIHCDRRQFNFWQSSHERWIRQEPLLPLLAKHWSALEAFANDAAMLINSSILMNEDRIGSRVVEGIFVPSLHELAEIRDQHSRASA